MISLSRGLTLTWVPSCSFDSSISPSVSSAPTPLSFLSPRRHSPSSCRTTSSSSSSRLFNLPFPRAATGSFNCPSRQTRCPNRTEWRAHCRDSCPLLLTLPNLSRRSASAMFRDSNIMQKYKRKSRRAAHRSSSSLNHSSCHRCPLATINIHPGSPSAPPPPHSLTNRPRVLISLAFAH